MQSKNANVSICQMIFSSCNNEPIEVPKKIKALILNISCFKGRIFGRAAQQSHNNAYVYNLNPANPGTHIYTYIHIYIYTYTPTHIYLYIDRIL